MSNKYTAAFLKSPLYLRDSFLKTPNWRWLLARIIINADISGLARREPSDAKVLFAVKLQRALKNPVKRQFILYKLPKVYDVCKLGTTLLNAPMRCELLACLINNLLPSAIALKLKWIDEIQVNLYKDLFFDLTGIKGLPGWFEQHLLIPLKGLKGGALFRARAIAYYFTIDAAIKSLRFGKSGKAAKLAMALMWKDLRNKRIFDYMAKNLNVPILIYTNIMLNAIQSILNRDFTLQLRGLGSLASTALLYANAILRGIRGFTQLLINSTEAAYKQGIDNANKYIQSILLLNKE